MLGRSQQESLAGQLRCRSPKRPIRQALRNIDPTDLETYIASGYKFRFNNADLCRLELEQVEAYLKALAPLPLEEFIKELQEVITDTSSEVVSACLKASALPWDSTLMCILRPVLEVYPESNPPIPEPSWTGRLTRFFLGGEAKRMAVEEPWPAEECVGLQRRTDKTRYLSATAPEPFWILSELERWQNQIGQHQAEIDQTIPELEADEISAELLAEYQQHLFQIEECQSHIDTILTNVRLITAHL